MRNRLIRLTESDLHKIVSKSVKNILKESEYDNGSHLLDELARYITMNRTWSSSEESKAFHNIEFYRCGIDYASSRIYNEMRDLAEEFALDNNIPEEWVDEIDFNDLFFNLGE